jgi:hypothetical protein
MQKYQKSIKSTLNPTSETRANTGTSQLPSTEPKFWVEIRLKNGEVIGYVQSDLGDFSETEFLKSHLDSEMGSK